jgi:1-acyl-sn-glycerol-3-phosphate acyltransferase
MPTQLASQVIPFARRSGLSATQLAVIPFTWFFMRRIGLQVHTPPGLSAPPGTLVLANHRSMLDPFIVTYHLRARNLDSTLPVRYPTTPDYARRPILGTAISLLGAYDIGSTPMEKAKKLLYTRDLLNQNCTVLLFPEGKIVSEGHLVSDFERGAQMLFAYDYPTVFVRLTGFETGSFLNPEKDIDAHLYYSDVIRGTAAEKIAVMERFFDEDKPWLYQ